jgi:hypothetical protein
VKDAIEYLEMLRNEKDEGMILIQQPKMAQKLIDIRKLLQKENAHNPMIKVLFKIA